MAIQGFFTGDVKIKDLNGVLKAVDGIVEVATDAGTVTSVGLTVGSTGTDVNVANSPITSSGNITLNLPTASATNRGLLSSADWSTFNSKQAAGNYVTLDTSQTITASKVFSVGFSIASAGGTNQPTFFENTSNLHSGSVGSNIFGFNTNNNIYFGKGSDNGGVLSWNNSEVRYYTLPNANGTLALTSQLTSGTVTSVAASITGNAIGITGSPITSSGTLAFAFAGNATQYVRGDGALATLPTSGGGGGASVSYYLNGSINQGTIGGVTYYEMNRTPVLGAGTDFTTSSNGYIASFLTDANDPALLSIPAGNFNFEAYFEASSGGGNPTFYIELYKYDGTTFTLIASNSTNPKLINDGTSVEAYFTALAVPQTTLTLTDRLAVRIYVNTSGRTITLHTENSNLCQVITTFTTGLTALNGLTAQVQYLATGTSGSDFNIASATATHTFNLPTASATNRGALSSADWTTFNNKQNALTNPITGTGTSGQVAYWNGTNTQTGSNNLFWDNTNGRLGIGTATPSDLLQVEGNIANPIRIRINNNNASGKETLIFYQAGVIQGWIESDNAAKSISMWGYQSTSILTFGTNNTERARIFANGNFGINTTTDAGFRLDVNGTARVQGNTQIVGDLSVPSGNYISVNGTGGIFGMRIQSSLLTITTNNANVADFSNGSVNGSILRLNQNNITATSGTFSTLLLPNIGGTTLAPTSGNVAYNGILINPTYNTTGTYSGAARGIYYNPTLTSVTGLTHIAFQNTSGDVLLATTSGNVAIGTSTLATATELTLGGSQTASSAIARGGLINTTLVAAANNDRLIGLDIAPTYTNGAFTGVTNIALRVGASIDMQGATIGNIGSGQTLLFAGAGTGEIRLTNGSGGGFFYTYYTNGSEKMRLSPTNGNLLLNTTTDAGFRLDVNGTARVQGQTSISSGDLTITNTNPFIKLVRTSTSINDPIIYSNSASVIGIVDFLTANKGLYINTSTGFGAFGTNGNSIQANSLFRLHGAVTASTAIARAQNITTELVASANNDVLVGLDINPTFTNGAFTGVRNYGLRIGSWLYADSINNRLGINQAAPGVALSNFQNPLSDFNSNFCSLLGIGWLVNDASKYAAGIANTNATGHGLQIQAGASNTSSRILTLTNGTGDRLIFNAAGNLLIGTTTDAGFRLDVNGTARVQGELTVNTVQIGLGGGAISTNTRVGVNALGANTTGSFNTAVGYFSMGQGVSITGTFNTGLGNNSIRYITSGNYNTGIGGNALTSVSTSSNNTGVGVNALQGLTTGGNNTSLGFQAGGFISGGSVSNITGSNSIFIGHNAFPLADAQTNQIVIGYNQVGLGSNTTVLGNTSTTLTALYGAVITGGTSVNASAQLQVDSTTKGFLPPRMTSAQRTAISSPATGLVVYDTTLSGIALYNGTNWQNVLVPNSNNNVLIGTTTDNGQGTLQNTGSAFLGGLQVGGLTFSTSTTATTSTIFYYFNGGSGQTLTLPSTVGISSYFLIKNAGTAALTISRSGSTDTIMAPNGTSTSTTISLAAGSQAILVSNGAFVWIQIV